ncbi:molybdenum cofactor guanylyltransferase [Streptomyces sp. NPDC059629]|uniref:molybdenum cofactor guanylyltransferase n=1 Tax=Streptomyces sp. NPDC059629 TaxID=3346889 RepID=UPI003680FC30
MESSLAAVLLAGGHGTRLGRDKATLRLGGESMVQRTVRQALRAGVRRPVVVVNTGNRDMVRRDLAEIGADAEIVTQRQPGALGAVLTGLGHAGTPAALFVAGITDLVPADTFARLADPAHEAHIAIATALLRERFVGGMLDLTDGGTRVRRIVERPEGGCPPGAPGNIWIHFFRGADTVRRLVEAVAETGDYESAVNRLIDNGCEARAVTVRDWVPVKTARSLTDDRVPGLTEVPR